MADIGTLRAGLAANLNAIPGWQVSAYRLSNPTPPSIHVWPSEITFDLAMGRGMDRLEFTVQAVVALGSDIGSQQKLDEFLAGSGALSVKAAIEADRTLGGACDALRVMRCSDYRGALTTDGAIVLAADFTVEVLARGGS